MSRLATIQSPEDTTEHVGSHWMFLRYRPRKPLQCAHDQRKTLIYFWPVPGEDTVSTRWYHLMVDTLLAIIP
jgi:hypothetical protein